MALMIIWAEALSLGHSGIRASHDPTYRRSEVTVTSCTNFSTAEREGRVLFPPRLVWVMWEQPAQPCALQSSTFLDQTTTSHCLAGTYSLVNDPFMEIYEEVDVRCSGNVYIWG